MNIDKESIDQYLERLNEARHANNMRESHFDYEVIATFDAPGDGWSSPGSAVITKSWSPSGWIHFGKNRESSETVFVISLGCAILYIPVFTVR